MNYKYLFIIVPLALFCFGIRSASGQAISMSQKTDALFAGYNKPDSPGVSVAVLKDGKIVFEKGYGSANLEYNIPNSPATIFHIASVSKQFTAFAILLLENDGKLSLDDDVRKYIPELPDFGKKITLSNLIYHTSGLRDQWELITMAGWRLDDVITTRQLLDIVGRQKELNFEPGTQHSYSNTGYMLLAEVVTRVSGMSFADFTNERIFKPLQMTHTGFCEDHEQIIKNRAYSYQPDGTGFKKCVLNYANAGATSLNTTVEDMCKWVMNFENPVAGNASIIKKMNTCGVLNNGDTLTYAMGQEKNRYHGLLFYSHGGADAGYRAVMGRFPDQHYAVVVLSNLASFDPTGMAIQITDLYLKDKFIAEKPAEKPPVSEQPAEFTCDPKVLEGYSGVYQLRPGFDVNIIFENNHLFAEAHEVPKTQLIQVSLADFTIPAMRAKITFAGTGNTIDHMDVDLNGQQMTATRKAAFDPKTENMDDYAGDYYSPELGIVYTFLNKNGTLTFNQVRMGEIPLTAIKPDQFSGIEYYLNEINFMRDGNMKVNGFRLSGVRARNIWFEKIGSKSVLD